MEFSEVVRRRRMIRHYSDKPLAPEVTERILASALRAPSAGACFFGIMPEHLEPFRAEFGVPDEYEPIGGITGGYRAEDVPEQSGRVAGRRRGWGCCSSGAVGAAALA